MISVIIPTLQKNLELLKALVSNLNKDSAVGEIIIVDNSLQGFDYGFEKVRIIIPEENLYVNPSWNLGVTEAKYDYIALFNDDVLVNDDFCEQMFPYMSEDKGILGSFGDKIECTKEENIYRPFEERTMKVSPTDCMINGFGVIMAGHRSAFPHIPEIMKVYGGDDFLFKMNSNAKKQNYLVYGVEMRHFGNLSSSNPILKEMKEQDEQYYIDNYDPPPQFSLPEKLFSIKIQGRHYVLRLLGLRFRMRRRIAEPIAV